MSKDTHKRIYDNLLFDSQLEMKFYRDWILPKMESGDIISCERQVKYELQEKFTRDGKIVLPINYIADFVVTYKNNHTVVFDTKGMPDSVAILKRKLFWHKYPEIDYRWMSFCKADGGWVRYETVKQGRKERKRLKTNTKEYK